MKNYTIILFKAPTCGPCKMFQPQLEKAVELFNNESTESHIDFETCDVSEQVNLDKATSLGIESSGEAMLFDGETVLIHWQRPQAFSNILNDIKVHCL